GWSRACCVGIAREPAPGMKRTVLIALAAAAASLALPAAAWAHAALLQTTPVASRVVNVPPKQVSLRYSEPVEPRFAIVSVPIARPVVALVAGTRRRDVTIAFGAASLVALVAIPVYFLLATAEFALRSFWSFGALFPLVRASAFGRGWLDLELVFALFAAAAAIAIWLDRPERRQRSLAALLALAGALGAAAAVLLVPGTVGHAGQTSPRGLSLAFDWF